MEQALYHPEHGYYSSGRALIGRRGDFFTSVSGGPVFGRLLCGQFAEIWEQLGRPAPFTLVEQGAHDGQFARDVLEAAAADHPAFLAALTYRIIEPFPVLRERQAERLRRFAPCVQWVAEVEQLSPFTGVFFANELVDAFPVHLLRRDQAEGAAWQERHVAVEQDDFVWRDENLSSPALPAHMEKLPLPATGPYQTEINLAAPAWMTALAPKLERGLLLLADYGLSRNEFFAPERREGTLRCYARHQVMPSPLEGIGETDITAHVEWTSLAEAGLGTGLSLAGFVDQHHFVTGLLASDPGRAVYDSLDPAGRRGLQTILHPQFLGIAFQFLGLARNLEGGLSGFQFASGSAARLGLAS